MYSENMAINGGTITQAKPADIPAMYEIEKVSRRIPWSIQDFSDVSKSDGNQYCCVARMDDGSIAGFSHMKREGQPSSCDISSLSVDPEKRGLGIGKALMRHMLITGSNAVYRGDIFSLSVDRDNNIAKTMYKKLGFEAWRTFEESGVKRLFMQAPKEAVFARLYPNKYHGSERLSVDHSETIASSSYSTHSSLDSNAANTKNKYTFDLIHAWRDHLSNFFDQDIDRHDEHGNIIRNDKDRGLYIKSNDGYYIELTPDKAITIGKIGDGPSLTLSAEMKHFIKNPQVNDEGHVDLGHFSMSHGLIYANDHDNRDSLIVKRKKISVGPLEENHFGYDIEKDAKFNDLSRIPNLNNDRITDLLPDSRTVESRYSQTAYDSRNHCYYNRKQVNGYLFVRENSSADYAKIRRALIIIGHESPATVAACSAIIKDGRSDVVYQPNDELDNSMSLTYNQMRQNRLHDYPETAFLNLDPSSAGVSIRGVSNRKDKQSFTYHDFATIEDHELWHSFIALKNMQEESDLRKNLNANFGNALEQLIITTFENPTRLRRNLEKRSFHAGYTFRTDGDVTSRHPKLIRASPYTSIAPRPESSQQHFQVGQMGMPAQGAASKLDQTQSLSGIGSTFQSEGDVTSHLPKLTHPNPYMATAPHPGGVMHPLQLPQYASAHVPEPSSFIDDDSPSATLVSSQGLGIQRKQDTSSQSSSRQDTRDSLKRRRPDAAGTSRRKAPRTTSGTSRGTSQGTIEQSELLGGLGGMTVDPSRSLIRDVDDYFKAQDFSSRTAARFTITTNIAFAYAAKDTNSVTNAKEHFASNNNTDALTLIDEAEREVLRGQEAELARQGSFQSVQAHAAQSTGSPSAVRHAHSPKLQAVSQQPATPELQTKAGNALIAQAPATKDTPEKGRQGRT